jgi:hypothetical protein
MCNLQATFKPFEVVSLIKKYLCDISNAKVKFWCNRHTGCENWSSCSLQVTIHKRMCMSKFVLIAVSQ